MFGTPIVQSTSEVKLFNLIGEYAQNKDYDVVYYKSTMPKIETSIDVLENNLKSDFKDLEELEKETNIVYKDMDYIHLYKNDNMIISIYYDKFNLGSMFPPCPYYELYDKCDVERFLDTEEDKERLFNLVKKII